MTFKSYVKKKLNIQHDYVSHEPQVLFKNQRLKVFTGGLRWLNFSQVT